MTKARDIASATTPNANAALLATFPHKNLIINGAMQVDQRNSGSSVTFDSGGTTSGFSADRHKFFVLGTGELDLACQQVSDAPAGFANSLKVTVSTAESSGATPAADDRASLQMRLEGHSVERLALGTSDAKTFVLSFYVKSSLTGNHGVVLASNVNRSYPVLYNIASANTWERKTIVVPGPTDGTWGTDANYGFAIKFGFYTGSSRDGADQGITGSGTWITNTTAQGVTNQVQLGGTLNATWQITGVQLELGDTATPFEHRSYGDELARCQRYYTSSFSGETTVGGSHPSNYGGKVFAWCDHYGSSANRHAFNWNWPVQMRATPTITMYGNQWTSARVSKYNAGNAEYTISYSSGASRNGLAGYYEVGVSGDFVVAYVEAESEL
jgi:hypothetical protein